MSNNIGQKVANIEVEQPWLPITQVKVNVDGSHTYIAGTTTGRTFEVDCAIGSQTVADNLLSVLNGYVYKAYKARDALIKPNIELGQSVSVGDVYSIVGGISLKGDMILAADLSAPASGELDHEYPYNQWKKVVVDAKNIRHGGGHGTLSGAALTPESVEADRINMQSVLDFIAQYGEYIYVIQLDVDSLRVEGDMECNGPAFFDTIEAGGLTVGSHEATWQSKEVVVSVGSSRLSSRDWVYIDNGTQKTVTAPMVTSVTPGTSTIHYLGY